MSHFYASIQGNRGEASRMGTKQSGIDGHIRGWNLGGRVSMCHDQDQDIDQVEVALTGGSGHHGTSVNFGRFTARDLEVLRTIEHKLQRTIRKLIEGTNTQGDT